MGEYWIEKQYNFTINNNITNLLINNVNKNQEWKENKIIYKNESYYENLTLFINIIYLIRALLGPGFGSLLDIDCKF
jgi:hypothetical protein